MFTITAVTCRPLQLYLVACCFCNANLAAQRNPPPDVPPPCCEDNTATCLSCLAGESIEEYCLQLSGALVEGCPPRDCCSHSTATCLACQNGMDVATFCEVAAMNGNIDIPGCSNSGGSDNVQGTSPTIDTIGGSSNPSPDVPPPCCEDNTATCLSCLAGESVEEYCLQLSGALVEGCPPRDCCSHSTATCLACQNGMDVATFCELAIVGSVPIVGCNDDVGGFLGDLTTHFPSTTFTIVTTEAAVPTSGTTSTVGAAPPNPAWPTETPPPDTPPAATLRPETPPPGTPPSTTAAASTVVPPPPAPPECCALPIAACLACDANQTVFDYCSSLPPTIVVHGCDQDTGDKTACSPAARSCLRGARRK